MKTNSFYCKKCCKRTRHIEVSSREAYAVQQKNNEKINQSVTNVGMTMADGFGISRAMHFIAGITPYKCTECGRCADRKNDGSEYFLYGYGN